MILTCEKCSTRYFVDDASLDQDGKNVKCVKCGYIWFQDSSQSTKQEKNIAIEPIPQGSSLPVIIETQTSIWLKIIPFFFLFMILVSTINIYRTNIIKQIPALEKFYNYIGMPITNDLALEAIDLVKGKDYLNINGQLINNAQVKRKVPNIEIVVSDTKGNKLLNFNINSEGKDINPNEKLPIHKRIFDLPENSHYITIDIAD